MHPEISSPKEIHVDAYDLVCQYKLWINHPVDLGAIPSNYVHVTFSNMLMPSHLKIPAGPKMARAAIRRRAIKYHGLLTFGLPRGVVVPNPLRFFDVTLFASGIEF